MHEESTGDGSVPACDGTSEPGSTRTVSQSAPLHEVDLDGAAVGLDAG